MKKHLIIVLSLILILCSFQVFAECGWVLWSKYAAMGMVKKTPYDYTTWNVVNAAPKYEQCLQMKEDYWNKTYNLLISSGAFENVAGERGDNLYMKMKTDKDGSGGISNYHYYCLPDTIDPREKK
jgi:hypothetical protein